MKKLRELMKRASLVLFLLFVGILFLSPGIVPARATPLRPDISTSSITIKNFDCRLTKDKPAGNDVAIPLDLNNISNSGNVDVTALKNSLKAYRIICTPLS